MFILADFIDSLKNLDSLFDLEEQVIRCLREMFQEIVFKYLIQLDETYYLKTRRVDVSIGVQNNPSCVPEFLGFRLRRWPAS
ncbi:hypothetical protein LOOC260_101340 [Paucilactobacillus hokkaidonensis JCM 18461]|uniref:Uncharacterized protein n=1 Tax=Paucilactobacillus hokkaidonensis JCM 18461 TaxID=1291742 RepID=A0A0A1GR01_9LACO|nr:hypothetical protein LOOC260_101340 [Paucilactobacillus hokkaidonensis JCM 18461]